MVYSPAVVIFRDDDGEWRSPVEVDVLTSAAVNVGHIRRGLEKEERLRIERLELEYWKRKGKERRKQPERAMAERQGLREEAKNKNEKEIAMLKKEQADMKEEISKLKNLVKEMDKRKESDREKIEEEEGEVEVENQEENQENTFDNPALGCGSDSLPKSTEDNVESEAHQEATFSPPTQPSQAFPKLPFRLALKNAEIQIQQTMYDRISRILHLFQLHQTSHLILGSFGTGLSKNRIDLIATIFADLLINTGGRFTKGLPAKDSVTTTSRTSAFYYSTGSSGPQAKYSGTTYIRYRTSPFAHR